MANTQPNQLPPNAAVSSGSKSGAAPSVPTALPPAAAISGRSDCNCHGQTKTTQDAASAAGFPSALQAPSLRPGATRATGAITATWQSNVHVTGMWSINQDRNCCAYLDNVGWRNLSGASESGLVSLNMLASHAYQTGATTSMYEEDDARISQIYVW